MGYYQLRVRVYARIRRLCFHSFCVLYSVPLPPQLCWSWRDRTLYFLCSQFNCFCYRILHFQSFQLSEKSIQDKSLEINMGKKTLNSSWKTFSLRILGNGKTYELHWRFNNGFRLLFTLWNSNRWLFLSHLLDHFAHSQSL